MAIKIRPYKGRTDVFQVDIRIELPSGETIRERKKAPVSSRTGARRWAEARERELFQRGMAPKPDKPKDVPTLSAFEKRYMDGHVKANRQKHSTFTSKESIFKSQLIPHLGSKRLDQITNEDVQKLKASLTHHSRKHTNNVLTVLSTVLKAAVEWNVIDTLPCTIKLVKVAPGEREFFDFDDYERLLEAAQAIDPRTHLLVLLGGSAGLRVGEILALEWPDVDFRRGLLTIQRAEWRGVVDTPKSGRGRRIPMTTRLAEALKAHRHLRGPRVLYRDDGTTVTAKLLKGWLATAEKRAQLPIKGNTHKLRHTFCSHLAMRGAPAKAIQELAGHADLSMTMRYMHLAVGTLDNTIRLLEQPASRLGKIVATTSRRSETT